MFHDSLMQTGLAAVGYHRLSKYIYRAVWSAEEVEHFLYFGTDSRGYFVADFGLRNPEAEKFGIEALVRYGHANFQLALKTRDAATDCYLRFDFASLNEMSQKPWPRFRLSTISGRDLMTLVVDFIRDNLHPTIGTVVDFKTYLSFLLADQEPNRWATTSNHMIRVAQIVAISVRLGLSNVEIKQTLGSYESQIEKRMRYIGRQDITSFNLYVDLLLSDCHNPH